MIFADKLAEIRPKSANYRFFLMMGDWVVCAPPPLTMIGCRHVSQLVVGGWSGQIFVIYWFQVSPISKIKYTKIDYT